MDFDYLVVGAGFAGSVSAERLANAGNKVIIIDKRLHLAGNAYDQVDTNGVLVHCYGPHIFHTQLTEVFDYLSNFTKWRAYEHRVRAMVEGKLLPIPINQTTINELYGLNLDEVGIGEFLKQASVARRDIRTSEDVAINAVGRDLYEKFFKGYTLKQWGLDPSKLCASVISRVPVRVNRDDRYFTDKYQFMPAEGFSMLFKNLLNHKNIQIELGIDFFREKKHIRSKYIIYTGPIDEYYGYRYGKLPYRSLRFEHIHFPDIDKLQPVAVVNYPNEHSFTRITEFKHLTGQRCSGTSIVREYPKSQGEAYYPIPNPDNQLLYDKYKKLADKDANIRFVGRLGQYKYLNMDQVVAEGLRLVRQIL